MGSAMSALPLPDTCRPGHLAPVDAALARVRHAADLMGAHPANTFVHAGADPRGQIDTIEVLVAGGRVRVHLGPDGRAVALSTSTRTSASRLEMAELAFRFGTCPKRWAVLELFEHIAELATGHPASHVLPWRNQIRLPSHVNGPLEQVDGRG